MHNGTPCAVQMRVLPYTTGGRDAIGHDRGQVSEANLPEGVRNGHAHGLTTCVGTSMG